MSKYQMLYDVIGRRAEWNDKTKTGRVLKWELSSINSPKAEREKIAEHTRAILAEAGITVQKVLVRNSKYSCTRSWYDQDGQYQSMTNTGPGYDKLTIYIDPM